MIRSIVFIAFFGGTFFGSAVFALETSPHKQGTFSSLNLGVRFSSLLQQRGVIFYRDFQIDPVVSLFFLDDRLEFTGDSLGYRDFVAGERVRLRTRVVAISDDPLFPENKSVARGMPDRKDSYEWNNGVEVFLPGYFNDFLSEWNLSHSKDFTAHFGNYLELRGKLRLFDFRVAGWLLEPDLVVQTGWGDRKHNRYFYGPEDGAGLNHYSAGFWIAFPERADRFYPIVQAMYFSGLGDHRTASYAQGRSEGVLFSFIVALDGRVGGVHHHAEEKDREK